MHVGSIQFRMLGLLAIGSVCALIACGGGGAAPAPAASTKLVTPVAPSSPSSPSVPSVAVLTLTPLTLDMIVNDQTQFTATVSGGTVDNPAVGWTALKGTITSSGLYTAPASPGSDTVTAYLADAPTTFATATVTVAAAPVAPVAPVVLPPTAPALAGPVELQAGSGPYTVTATVDTGATAQWTITGGTLLSSPSAASALFTAGAGPYLNLTCTVSNAAGSAASDWWMVALPFAPRNHLADLKASLAANAAAIEAEVLTGDPSTYYYTSYYLHGMAAAAEATGDTQVMDALVGYITQMISLAKPLVRNGVTYQQWVPLDVNGNPQQLDCFQVESAFARTAAVIAGNPVFLARYGTNLTQIVNFVDQSVFKYWFDKQTGIYANPGSAWLGGYVPWLPTNLGGWGEASDVVLWNDKTSHFGTMAAYLYQVTRNPLYLEYATRVAKAFKTHVTLVNGGWIWDYGTYPTATYSDNLDGTPDTSHANREPMMVAAMYEAGIYFQLADLQAIAATFSNVIWNQSQSSPMFCNYIDGGNAAYGVFGPWHNGNIYHGWNVLGKYSPKAMLALAVADQIIQSPGGGSVNASMPTNTTSYGLIEMAGTQALNIAR